MRLSRLEVILLMDLGCYVGPGFYFVKPSPARSDALERFQSEGLIERNSGDARWADGQIDERPWVLTRVGERLCARIMNPQP